MFYNFITYKYSFSENGVISYKNGKLLNSQTFIEYIGEENYKVFINDILNYLSCINIPIKRGTFVEFRTGMINISLIGRSCSPEERNNFELYDKHFNIRKNMIEYLEKKYVHLKLKYSIGGQISFDVFPIGWDKTYCLQFIDFNKYDEVHFFGDKTQKGGNDYEIFIDKRVIGHTVTGPEDTKYMTEKL